jgi:hypothetical protein
MKLTPPQVGRLLARPRAWAWLHIRVGDFGPARRAGRAWCVDLADVEAFAGGKFSDAQIFAAVNPGCVVPAVAATESILETVP